MSWLQLQKGNDYNGKKETGREKPYFSCLQPRKKNEKCDRPGKDQFKPTDNLIEVPAEGQL